MPEPRRFCDACGQQLPGGTDPTDDLCDSCGWDRAVMDGEAEETSAEAERRQMACPMTHLPEMPCGACGKPVEGERRG